MPSSVWVDRRDYGYQAPLLEALAASITLFEGTWIADPACLAIPPAPLPISTEIREGCAAWRGSGNQQTNS
jgi:hypothetical protein